MACNLTTARMEQCKESVGGIAGVYFINFTTGSFTKDGSGEVTAVPSGTQDVSGTVTAVTSGVSTATVTSVTVSSSTSTQLLTSNSSRLMATFYHSSTDGSVFLKWGTSASSTSHTIELFPDGFYEMHSPIYTGEIQALSSAGSNILRITEM